MDTNGVGQPEVAEPPLILEQPHRVFSTTFYAINGHGLWSLFIAGHRIQTAANESELLTRLTVPFSMHMVGGMAWQCTFPGRIKEAEIGKCCRK